MYPKTYKMCYILSYQFGIIWQKSILNEIVHWKEYIKKLYIELDIYKEKIPITILEGIMLLDFFKSLQKCNGIVYSKN
jgi:hypothetical protein